VAELRALMYGGVPVPFTASWSSEERFFVAPCRWADRRPAICQPSSPGEGKPLFGKPHAVRQRQAIADGLCDLCARPLATRTKVSLSHAKVYGHGAEGPAILQVEPLLDRACAAISLRHCPSLRRDVRDGSVMIRQVTRHRVQVALMSAEYVAIRTGEDVIAAGHAKVELLRWIDRDAAWLEALEPLGAGHG
jgi:hypothetical protein